MDGQGQSGMPREEQGCLGQIGDAQGRLRMLRAMQGCAGQVGDAQGSCTVFSQVTPVLVPLAWGGWLVAWRAPGPSSVQAAVPGAACGPKDRQEVPAVGLRDGR